MHLIACSPFSSEPLSPSPKPLIIVISRPSGVGKDVVIKRLREIREGIHFVVTATSRGKRQGEVDGKDYHFVSKQEFLSMVERNELLEYALVYGDYKGIPKQQIRDFMSKGYDIVLRVDIQGAATLRRILGDSAIFIFLVAESENALVQRLVGRKLRQIRLEWKRYRTIMAEHRLMCTGDRVVDGRETAEHHRFRLVESELQIQKRKPLNHRLIISIKPQNYGGLISKFNIPELEYVGNFDLNRSAAISIIQSPLGPHYQSDLE
ncbi:Guanylate kinase [Thalictrum thalictroides]|uniref:Guanylate kinase n=1 Tax=Thalictrum thalictroides TaxID=46969 RepID=A0A7J6W5F2_THATH|nr:Guanylate kinase [Thalictrum thalictroides]